MMKAVGRQHGAKHHLAADLAGGQLAPGASSSAMMILQMEQMAGPGAGGRGKWEFVPWA